MKPSNHRERCVFLLLLLIFPLAALGQQDSSLNSIRLQLTPVRHTILSSEIAGRVAEISVREGDAFEAGSTLLKLDCSLHQARLAKAEAQSREARKVEEVNSELDRMGTISRLEFDVASARLEAAQADVSLMSGIVDRCSIQAPFSGKLAGLLVQPHQFVAEGQELLEVLDDSVLELEMFVPSSWLSGIRPGLQFSVLIDETGQQYPATVSRIAPAVDAVSQSVKIYGRIDGRFAELRSGMSGTANLSP